MSEPKKLVSKIINSTQDLLKKQKDLQKQLMKIKPFGGDKGEQVKKR